MKNLRLSVRLLFLEVDLVDEFSRLMNRSIFFLWTVLDSETVPYAFFFLPWICIALCQPTGESKS